MGETQARSTMARVAGLSLLVAIPGAFLVASRSQAPLGGSALLSSASSPLGIEVSNEYTATRGHPAAMYPSVTYGRLVEPHRATTLKMGNVAEDPSRSYGWTIAKSSGAAEDAVAIAGHSATYVFASLGTYAVTARLDASPDDPSQQGGNAVEETTTVECKYVRRNIFALRTAEREKLFDAFKTLMTVDTATGLESYGINYRSLDYFTETHLDRAARRDIDTMHDGMGFLTQHVAVTNELELALQAVDASLALPFWDYTEDIARVRGGGGNTADLWSSKLWTDDWYGNATHDDRHTVTKGRFAYQKVTRDRNATTHNPYGYLRAPWNVNKDPYLTRNHEFCDTTFSLDTWPSCEAHYNLTFSYDNWFDYVWTAGYAPHGPIHYFIGGFTHCGDLSAQFPMLDAEGLKSLALMQVGITKNFWRDGLFESPTYCSDDTPQDQCHLVCKGAAGEDDFAAAIVAKLLYYAENFYRTGLSDITYAWLDDLQVEDYEAFVTAFCQMSWYPGEQMEAASPADVSFWSIHPTMERLLHYKMLADPFVTKEWKAYGDISMTSYCEYSTTTDCKGHHGYDLTAFKSMVLDVETGDYAPAYLTNGEIFDHMSLEDYKMSYYYEDFSWPHCEARGVVFPAVSS